MDQASVSICGIDFALQALEQHIVALLLSAHQSQSTIHPEIVVACDHQTLVVAQTNGRVDVHVLARSGRQFLVLSSAEDVSSRVELGYSDRLLFFARSFIWSIILNWPIVRSATVWNVSIWYVSIWSVSVWAAIVRSASVWNVSVWTATVRSSIVWSTGIRLIIRLVIVIGCFLFRLWFFSCSFICKEFLVNVNSFHSRVLDSGQPHSPTTSLSVSF